MTKVLAVVALMLLVVMAGIAGTLVWLTEKALQGAEVVSTDYNPSRTCLAKRLEASLEGKAPAIVGRLFFLLHSRTYFEVYTQQGELIGSTRWRFFQPTAEGVASEWVTDIRYVYPGEEYEEIKVRQCAPSGH
ncbi:hypothetical protein [Xanthomonas oryzae]|nr:hypothetical protein [Xanthomonas oryzae]QBG94626.1 hypothetical protein EYC55_02785 [Xanthomonas oryzae]QBH01329.1 hypothetical protein EYC56_21280 [Xanthomonas oryzae]